MTSFINFYSQRSLNCVREIEKKEILKNFIDNLVQEYIPCKNRDDNYVTNCFCLSTIRDDEDKRISLDNTCYNYMNFDSKTRRLYLIGISTTNIVISKSLDNQNLTI